MSKSKDRLVVGLSGSFGSGCSTLKNSLVELGFEPFSLSKFVKDVWCKETGKPIEEALRENLQDVGDKLRGKNKRNSYLAELAIGEANEKARENSPLVFDNIRNIGEVDYFRKTFPNFFLIAVDCSPKIRWERVKKRYQDLGLNENQFEEDDKRDKYDEKTKYGQQVELCVDDADVLIDNDRTFPTDSVAVDKLKDKISQYINLMKGDIRRPPNPFELYMGIAYTASLRSQCLKRRVGAVIIDERSDAIVSVGYNENPPPIEPCISKYHRCYRDIYKLKYFQKLENSKQECPRCGQELKDSKPPFLCQKCGFDLDKYFISDKALNRCTALHAEERAILGVGSRNIEGCTIYTTTFPCFGCAQKIVYSKLASVVYVEPYPDEDSVDLLKEADVSVRKFEGVKAKAYFRLFGAWRREMEDIPSVS